MATASPSQHHTEISDATCRICGCTEDRACPGGCWWVPDPEMGDLCSACAGPMDAIEPPELWPGIHLVSVRRIDPLNAAAIEALAVGDSGALYRFRHRVDRWQLIAMKSDPAAARWRWFPHRISPAAVDHERAAVTLLAVIRTADTPLGRHELGAAAAIDDPGLVGEGLALLRLLGLIERVPAPRTRWRASSPATAGHG